MRMYWWQAGLHIESESKEDHERLVSLWHLLQELKLVDRSEEVRSARRRGDLYNHEPVVPVENGSKPVEE